MTETVDHQRTDSSSRVWYSIWRCRDLSELFVMLSRLSEIRCSFFALNAVRE